MDGGSQGTGNSCQRALTACSPMYFLIAATELPLRSLSAEMASAIISSYLGVGEGFLGALGFLVGSRSVMVLETKVKDAREGKGDGRNGARDSWSMNLVRCPPCQGSAKPWLGSLGAHITFMHVDVLKLVGSPLNMLLHTWTASKC